MSLFLFRLPFVYIVQTFVPRSIVSKRQPLKNRTGHGIRFLQLPESQDWNRKNWPGIFDPKASRTVSFQSGPRNFRSTWINLFWVHSQTRTFPETLKLFDVSSQVPEYWLVQERRQFLPEIQQILPCEFYIHLVFNNSFLFKLSYF